MVKLQLASSALVLGLCVFLMCKTTTPLWRKWWRRDLSSRISLHSWGGLKAGTCSAVAQKWVGFSKGQQRCAAKLLSHSASKSLFEDHSCQRWERLCRAWGVCFHLLASLRKGLVIFISTLSLSRKKQLSEDLHKVISDIAQKHQPQTQLFLISKKNLKETF